jgi:hypothetical protein
LGVVLDNTIHRWSPKSTFHIPETLPESSYVHLVLDGLYVSRSCISPVFSVKFDSAIPPAIEFDFDDINAKNRKLENLLTVMQIKEGFNIEYKKYLNEYPDKGTFCSDFSGDFKCFTISAYFCSKLYKNLGNQTNAVKNKKKIMECYEKVDFLRFFTTIKEDPETKNLKKLTEENVQIMKKRFTKHFGKRKTKGAFQSVDLDIISEGGNNDRVEYFSQLMKTINACEDMFKTSKVLHYAEARVNSQPTTKASEQ